MLDKGDNTALVEELVFFLAPLVLDGDFDSSIQKRQLAQSLRKNVKAKLGGFEDLAIGLKGDPRPALLGFSNFRQTSLRLAPLVALLINSAVALDLDFQSLRQSVNHRNTYAVQTTGNLVRSFIELTTCVELGKHNFCGGDFFRLMNVHRNSTTIVDHRDAIIDVNRDINLVAITGQSLVNGVVHTFIHEMMKSPFTGVTDVHSGALSDRFQPFQNFYVIRSIVGRLRGICFGHFLPTTDCDFTRKILRLAYLLTNKNITGKSAKSKAKNCA